MTRDKTVVKVSGVFPAKHASRKYSLFLTVAEEWKSDRRTILD